MDFWTSHEALILGYEEALTRRDSLTGDWYDTSAHLLWVGERTRQLDGAHLQFLSGVDNPLGGKLGPTATPDDVVALCGILDPDRVPGRLTLISRMGAGRWPSICLPPLQRAVRDRPPGGVGLRPHARQHVRLRGRAQDPPLRRRARRDLGVLRRVPGEGVWPGGVHVELTGDNVTECLGGAEEIVEDHLELRYTTTCDPRLNARQSLDLAFRVAELLAPVNRRASGRPVQAS